LNAAAVGDLAPAPGFQFFPDPEPESGEALITVRAAVVPANTVFISGATGVAGRNVASLEAAGVDAMVRLTDPEDEIRKTLAA
jgi:hypothetical protein